MLTMDTEDGRRFTLRSRWGHGIAAHPQLAAVLERSRADYERLLAEIEQHGEVLSSIRQEHDPNNPLAPCWNNIWFTALDATMLVSFLLARRPKNYLEIGSGNSTMFTSHTRHAANLPTVISSIDPRPRAEIDTLCQRKIRAPLEDCDLALFDELGAGDILFFDGSHRVFMNSDVTVFFLEVIQRLKPGVLVHIHDIFLPADYPPDWSQSLFAEQYMLAAMLLCGTPPFKVIFPGYFVCTDTALAARARALLGALGIPFDYPNAARTLPSSFWLEITSTRASL
jgi:predicted O-methyltransferase YrrM